MNAKKDGYGLVARGIACVEGILFGMTVLIGWLSECMTHRRNEERRVIEKQQDLQYDVEIVTVKHRSYWEARVEGVEGLVAHGHTKEEAVRNTQEKLFKRMRGARRKREETIAQTAAPVSPRKKQRPVIAILTALVIVASLTYLWYTQRQVIPKPNLDSYLALGQGLAEETAKLLSDKDEVVLITMDARAHEDPAVKAETEAFIRTLRKAGFKAAAMERLTLNEFVTSNPADTGLYGMRYGMGDPIFPSEEAFLEILRKYPQAGAIVSLVGLPSPTETAVAGLRKRGGKSVVFSSGGRALKTLLEKRAIDLVIVPRYERLTDQRQQNESLRSLFNRHYQAINHDVAMTLDAP